MNCQTCQFRETSDGREVKSVCRKITDNWRPEVVKRGDAYLDSSHGADCGLWTTAEFGCTLHKERKGSPDAQS